MRLTLIRHAKSSWKDPGSADFERPLNARGSRDCVRMSSFLASRLATPDWCVSSDAVRARLTTEAVIRALQVPDEHVHYDHRVYLASAANLLQLITETHAEVDHLALVGHNPGLTELANLLDARADIDNVPTLGVVDLELDVDDWLAVSAGDGRVLNVFRPRQVAALPSPTCAGDR